MGNWIQKLGHRLFCDAPAIFTIQMPIIIVTVIGWSKFWI